jgi:antitoxin MazE
MKARIVRIGNSQRVRIPKPIKEQTGLRGEVDIIAEKDAVVIRPAARPRAGWAVVFREMAWRGDDRLLDDVGPTLSTWDKDVEPEVPITRGLKSELVVARSAALRISNEIEGGHRR